MSDEVRDAAACCEKTVKMAMQRLRMKESVLLPGAVFVHMALQVSQ